MNQTLPGVRTRMPALPAKLVRKRTFDRDVTTSASSPRTAIAVRTVCNRGLSAALGAYDMDGVQPLFEGGDLPQLAGLHAIVCCHMRHFLERTRRCGLGWSRGLRRVLQEFVLDLFE